MFQGAFCLYFGIHHSTDEKGSFCVEIDEHINKEAIEIGIVYGFLYILLIRQNINSDL